MYTNRRRIVNETEEEDDTDESLNVKVVNKNHIYLYGEIDMSVALDFNTKFNESVTKYKKVCLDIDIEPVFNIHINSCGGIIVAALSMIETIKRSKCKINTYIEGECSSAATLIAVIGDKRFMGEYSLMLIHQLRSGFWGTASDFAEENKNNKKFMKIIKNIYLKHTSIESDAMEKMLLKDSYMTSKKSKKMGLVDEII